jgi:hypothetical protein
MPFNKMVRVVLRLIVLSLRETFRLRRRGEEPLQVVLR